MTGYDDLKKMWLGHELILAKLQRFGDVHFVDFVNGLDTNHGETPKSPLQTLNAAMDKCTAGNHDVVLCRGFKNASSFSTVKQTLDVKSVHVIGAEYFKNFNENCGLYKGTAANDPIIDIPAEDVELCGMALDSRWILGARTTDSDNQIQALEVSGDGVGGGIGAYLHHLRFPAWYSLTGILVRGAGYCEFEDITFEGYATYAGLYAESDGVNNPAFMRFKNLKSKGCKYTLEWNTNNVNDWEVDGIIARSVGTSVMYLGSGAAQYGIAKGIIGDVAKAALFVGAGGAATTIANLTTNYKVTAADCWGNDSPLVA